MEEKMTDKSITRRSLLKDGMLASGVTGLGLGALFQLPASALTLYAKRGTGDLVILNAALDLEHQAIWAYSAAAPKLSNTDVGKTVLALALRNQADHKLHRDALTGAINKLNGTPVASKDSYDLSPYIKAGEGNLDSDANIAKLALALEVDAALAYCDAFSKLKGQGLIAAAASIGPNEVAHATAIRAVFRTLIPTVEYVPAAFISADTRAQWILKV
jgi:rubrerythrin